MNLLTNLTILIITALTWCILSFGYDDLSKDKIADQSLTWDCNRQTCANLYLASNAVDRDIATCTRSKYIGRSAPDKTMWWEVDLGAIYSIHSIAILFKDYDGAEQRQRGRFAGFSLFLSNSGVPDNDSPCYVDGPELPPLNFTTTCVGYGRYVTFYNERLDKVNYPTGYEVVKGMIELCEVIVRGCQNLGVYGSSCDIPCSKNCQDKICNIVNGTCFGCLPGWTGTLCENKCPHRWYGQVCKNECSGQCRGDTACNHVTGNCDNGCAAGWMTTKCDKQCIAGTYGSDCIYNCSGHCQNDVICNRETGHCDLGCKPGYTGHFCNESCQSRRFGDRCKERCSGHCLNDKVCHHVDGICADGCKDGYIGKWCNKSCDLGFFGTNCSAPCPENCIDTCRHTDGFCDCSSGYKGPNCNLSTSCVGSYGINCVHKCSGHCLNNTCDKSNGSCARGCLGSFHGEKCDQVDCVMQSEKEQWRIEKHENRVLDRKSDTEPECNLPISWIVGFTVSVTLNVFFVFIGFINLRKTLPQKECKAGRSDATHYISTDSIQIESGDTSTDYHNYQELNMTRDENLYQEIQSQRDIT